MSATVTSAIESGLTVMLERYGCQIIDRLCEHFKLDKEEANRICIGKNVEIKKAEKKAKEPKEKTEKAEKKPKKVERNIPNFPLPFCGVVVDEWCTAIRANRDLFTQCTNEKLEGDKYCKGCRKAADGNDGTNPLGDIELRLESDLMGFEIKGKHVVPYGNILAKIGKTRGEAEAEAARFGWKISDEQFEVRKGSRGRPRAEKKDESDNEDKKRGRPRKEVAIVNKSKNKGDDLIAQLVAEACAADADSESDAADVESPATEEEPAIVEADPKIAKAAEKEKKNKAAKEAEKAAKEAEKAAAKAEKEAKAAAAKAEKEAKAAAAKAEKEAEKAAKAAAKEAAKTATKPAAKKAEKDNKPAKAVAVVAPKPAVVETKEIEEEEADEESEEEIEVSRIKIDGKSYLLATSGKNKGKLYNPANNKGVGLWNEETKEIEELPEEMISEDDDDDE